MYPIIYSLLTSVFGITQVVYMVLLFCAKLETYDLLRGSPYMLWFSILGLTVACLGAYLVIGGAGLYVIHRIKVSEEPMAKQVV